MLSAGVERLEVDGTEGVVVLDVPLGDILLEEGMEIDVRLSAADSAFWCTEAGCVSVAVAQPWSFGNRC